MAENEDNREAIRNEAFMPEGPFCDLSRGPGRDTPIVPQWIWEAEFVRQRAADVERWENALDTLRNSAKSGSIEPALALMLVQTIKDGLMHKVPAAWLSSEPDSLPARTYGDFSYLAGFRASAGMRAIKYRVMAVAYRIAVERGYLTDPTSAQTARDRWGIKERQWLDWLRDYRSFAEEELERLLLNCPFLLQEKNKDKLRSILLMGDPCNRGSP